MIEIDHTECMGPQCGVCESVAPHTFITDDGKIRVTQHELDPLTYLACDICPIKCISF